MGGGDLNLKKSWHPSTLRNIERVWKAEEKHKAEKEKIEQLQKELAAERNREEIQAYAEDQGVVKKKNERLDWMYQGPTAMVNREDYLMGRKIDKTLELLEMQESGKEPKKDEDGQPGELFFQSTSTVTVDLANKIREDPLFAIKKKEKEQRKNLLNNPVKMKQLQEILKRSLSKNGKKKKSKKQKKKKMKHKSKSSDSSNSDDSSDDSSSCDERNSKNYHDKKHTSTKPHKMPKNQDSVNSYQERKKKYGYDPHSESDSSPKRMKNSRRDEHENRYMHSYSERRERNESRETSFNRKEYQSKSESRRDWYNNNNRNKHEEKKKLSSVEREQRLQEMMENAKWRDDQRRKIVQKYDEETEREENMKKDDPSRFIKPMLSNAAEKGNLERRLKQNIFSIQRNKSDMNKNFVKR